jgi:signal transduction histidine kinase
VELRVWVDGGEVALQVRDHGVGIPAEKLAAIFERFGQAHGARYGGLGLGLTISQGIIEQHGGRIWAESQGIEKEGSTFHVRLPVQSAPPEQAPRS